MNFHLKTIFFGYCPLPIWPIKTCNQDILKIIIAKNFKLGQLIRDNKHNAAFHQGLHCILRQTDFQKMKCFFCSEIITCDSLIYTMDHTNFIASN